MKNLRELRISKGLSLQGVAYLAGVDAATVSRVERGRVMPRPETVVALARVLGVSVERMRRLVEAGQRAHAGVRDDD